MNRFLVWLSAKLIRLIGASLRMSVEDRGGILNKPNHPPVIIAFWHDRTALILYFSQRFCRGRKIVGFISRSRDGQFISDVAAAFGVDAVRGSSSRNGMAAMLTAIRAAKDDRLDLALTPDGPRGPRHQIQRGLLRLAQTTGRPIVAVRYDLGWRYRLRSWDRFQVPIPFSHCHFITGERIFVPEGATEEQLTTIDSHLRAKLGED